MAQNCEECTRLRSDLKQKVFEVNQAEQRTLAAYSIDHSTFEEALAAETAARQAYQQAASELLAHSESHSAPNHNFRW